MHTGTTTAAPHDAATASFNHQLAHAKLAALDMLRQLMHTLTDLAAEDLPQVKHWPGRELRLIATAILRTRPLVERGAEPTRSPSPDHPPTVDRASGPDKAAPDPPPDPTPPPSHSLLARLDPTAILARNDIRTLVRDGYLPASLLNLLPSPAPAFRSPRPPSRPP